MQISQINNYNTSFSAGLHAPLGTYRAIGWTKEAFFNNPSIRAAAEKYDVVIKAGCDNIEKLYEWYPMNIYFRTIGTSLLGSIIGGITGVLLGANAELLTLAPYICTPAIGIMGLNFWYNNHKYKPVSNIVVQAGKGVDRNYNILNHSTREYRIDNPNTQLPLTNEIKTMESIAFSEFMKTIDTNNLYTAKNYLNVLKKADIKLLGEGDFFNRPIDQEGNTMLTQFFNVVRNEETQKEYNEIINIIQNTNGINYNQKDSDGVSCIEKIITSENEQCLPLICGAELDYSPSIDTLYNNIDPSFRYQLDRAGIKFKFIDILDAIECRNVNTLYRLKSQLESPFCDRQALEEQIKAIIKKNSLEFSIRFRHEVNKFLGYDYYWGPF